MLHHDPIDVAVGARIRERRRALGCRPGELSAALGVSFAQLRKYEQGRNRVSASAMILLAAKLDTTVARLVGERELGPFEGIGRADLEAPGAVDLLDCYVSIAEPDVRRLLLDMATALARDPDKPTATDADCPGAGVPAKA
jgi:transcriptional regulator with XRE-family HTH domain